jgi:hypothetical protein
LLLIIILVQRLSKKIFHHFRYLYSLQGYSNREESSSNREESRRVGQGYSNREESSSVTGKNQGG